VSCHSGCCRTQAVRLPLVTANGSELTSLLGGVALPFLAAAFADRDGCRQQSPRQNSA